MSRDQAHIALADHVAALDDLAARPSLAAAIEARRAGAALAEALHVDPDERPELMAALERLMLRLFGEGTDGAAAPTSDATTSPGQP